MCNDQRDAICNVGDSIGLPGGQAEDLIDEYLDQASGRPLAPVSVAPVRAMAVAAAPVAVSAPPPRAEPSTPIRPASREINVSPLGRSQERQKYPNFTNALGIEMLLVPSGQFLMGSNAFDAQQNEQPVTPVTQACFFSARFPVTNAQYEMFDPPHRTKRSHCQIHLP